MKKQPSRDERIMRWVERKNALYAPLIQPASFLGIIVTTALNRPAFATLFVTVFVASLSAGKKRS